MASGILMITVGVIITSYLEGATPAGETGMTPDGKWCNIEILNPEKHAEELFGAYIIKHFFDKIAIQKLTTNLLKIILENVVQKT